MPEPEPITFERHPATYRHWRLEVDGPVATVTMAVDPSASLGERLRAQAQHLRPRRGHRAGRHRPAPPLRAPRGPGGGAHQRPGEGVLRRGQHPDAGRGQPPAQGQLLQVHQRDPHWPSRTPPAARARCGWRAVNGTAAGGGYELALACEEIILVDDRSSAVSLPEVPLLGVLPGTGGLTRLVDKRHVRRDLADVVATRAEGVQGRQALDWGLVDSTVTRSHFADHVAGAGTRACGPVGDRPGRRRPRDLADPARAARTGAPASATPRSRSATDASPRRRHREGPRPARRPARQRRTRSRRPGRPGGRWRPVASSTTPSCTCASTSRSWAPGSSRTEGDPAAVLATEDALAGHDRPLAGPRGPGLLDAHPQAARRVGPHAWWPSSSRAAASPAPWPSWPWPPIGRFMLDGHVDGRDERPGRPPPVLVLAEVNDGLLPDGQRPQPPGHPLLGSRRDRLDAARAAVRQGPAGRATAWTWAW